jgi:hypothetical protein
LPLAEENAPPVKAPLKDIDEGDNMRALGEMGCCQIAFFGHALHSNVDCHIIAMIFHAKNHIWRSIFATCTQLSTSFGDVVAYVVQANVPVHRQCWEHVMKSSHNIDLCIDFRLMRGRVYVMWFVSHVFIWFVLSHFFLALVEL